MCTWLTRVHSCGHYTKTLQAPCEEASKAKKVCDSGSEDSKTTGGLCYLPGCDKKPGIRREGPGKTYQSSPKSLRLRNQTGDRTDGGFDPDDVDL